MTRQEFNELSEKEKNALVTEALAWLCVQEIFNPILKAQYSEHLDVIKIVLGMYREKN